MGRNAQKRRARKLRDDKGPSSSEGGHVDDEPRRASERTPSGRAGPLWLRSTVVSIGPVRGAGTTGDALLEIALAAARGASLDDIARRVARAVGADELLLVLDGVDGGRGLAKRPGHESIPGIEALVDVSAGMALHDPWVIENVASEPRLPSAPGARANTGSLVVIPLTLLGARHGVLAAARGEVGGFPLADVVLITAIADQLAQDLVQARALRLAWTDPLTGALSRQALFVLLEREIERARRTGDPLALAVIDIDGLIALNEAHGRHAGDVVLRAIAERAVAMSRGAEVCGRLGADKFLFLLDGELEEASEAGRRLLEDLLGRPVDVGGTPVPVRASIGLAGLAPQEDTLSLLGRAEGALALAKRRGGATFVVAAMDEELVVHGEDEG